MKNRNHIFTKVLLALSLFAARPAPNAFGVVPAPDGGYPGFTTAEGANALKNLTTGAGNTALGWFSLFSNTDGSFNTGVGAGTLVLNVGNQSTGEGVDNTAVGAVALFLNATGSNNTANGTAALVLNDTGSDNTAVGAFALNSNTDGDGNTAVGRDALSSNSGNSNTAIGSGALRANTTGTLHTAVGFNALASNTASDTGVNTAVGANALSANTTGGENTAVGFFALPFSNTGSLNTALGFGAGAGITAASNVTCIGPVSGVSTVAGEVSDACYIAHIHDQPVDSGTAQFVFVDEDGKLGTMNFSSQRFKKEIRPMGQTSEAVLALKPVTFQYKNDKKGAPQFGLIAEEVAKVNPDLVVHDKKGEIVGVRYDGVNAMLLNEFLKEHRTLQEQGATIAELKKEIAVLKAGLQKVSAETETNRPEPRVASNRD
jgi:Chaperone of endosialidase